ncbi:magnesium/cobalt transporter CorA [Aureibaculum conchae]|uniref:magnesium/cobalt transporter CorA n=1 Tax=Aureibaculum sp. 2308TA14-22 TaxID=3108392 RepID=UPI003396C1DA
MSKKRNKIGLPPGSVVFTGNKKMEKVQIHYIQYDNELFEEKTLSNHDKIILHQSPEEEVDWYDIRGVHDTVLIEKLGHTFNIHPLILEDVSNTYQRPKCEEYENGIFIIIKALAFDKTETKITIEQVAICFRKGFVISFQETESDLFEAVRKRIQSKKGRIRQKGADYLAYSLIDVIVDNYFLLLEDIGEEIESLEDRMLDNQDSNNKSAIHRLKKELLTIRKSIAPLREAIGRFAKTDSPLVEKDTPVFIRDLYDHTIQVMDTVESFRDLLNGLQDLYISEVSFKMNQVMQMLTLVATIFIPLTFLAGIYGMNFENIPELRWKYGYFAFWGFIVVIFVGLLIYFKRKKWL